MKTCASKFCADNYFYFSVESDSSSDWQSDWESTDEVEEDGAATACPKSAEKGKKSKKHSEKIQTASTSVAGFESDASDGQSEKCPICLLSFRNQEIATPSSCEHSFCLECIEEWSKNVNNCPVDRKNFTVIHVRSKLGGKVKIKANFNLNIILWLNLKLTLTCLLTRDMYFVMQGMY